MVRVPTYSSYMNLVNRTLANKATFEKYNLQSVTGLKHDRYSGYGLDAYSILNLESSLGINNNFLDNNSKLETELKALTTAMESIESFLGDVRTHLTSISGMDLEKMTPDYTGGEITFTDNNAAYLGETITVDGVQYTFANNSTGNNIDISALTPGSATYAEDVMSALQAKLPANADFTFANGKFSFPLYTINGTSSVLNVNGVETGKPHTMTSEQNTALKQLQSLAFNSMKALVDSLNMNIDGNYLLGGGVSDKKPVQFPFSTLEEFQAYYDGVNINYPTTASANLSNMKIDAAKTGNITLSLINDDENKGRITAANTGGFLNEAISANAQTTGNLTFDSNKNTIKATEADAFETLKAGDTLVISGGASGGNDKAYIIKSISADGKTITVDESTPVAADATVSPADNVKFSTSFPVGSTVNLENFGTNIAGHVQVTGISNDGTELYFTVDANRFPSSTAPVTITTGNWSMETDSYYNGGTLSSERRITENQTISFDITAQDPAFEKLFRALGSIAQGNLVDQRNPADDLTSLINSSTTANIIEEAMKLVQEATNSNGGVGTAKNADMQAVFSKISTNYISLTRAIETQGIVQANLEDGIYKLKNVDKTEAAALALIAQNNLNASYSVLQMALSTSLLNYMK